MLVLAHAARPDALVAAKEVCEQLRSAGLTPVIAPAGHPLRAEVGGVVATLEEVSIDQIELTIVLGGDGTILGAAELTRGSAAPLLGINHGHVGFLAESEKDDLAWTVATALAGDYVVEERLVLDVSVRSSFSNPLPEGR